MLNLELIEMKIDEDLIYEQYEEIRNQLVKYFNLEFCQEERDVHSKPLRKIVMPYREFIQKLKIEQLEREEIFRTELEQLYQERVRFFEL